MQTFSIHSGDTVGEERSGNYVLEIRNWIKEMKSGKWRKVETLHFELELAVLIASTHLHDVAELVKNDNWMLGE
jgi:hypothetical protein